MRGMTDLKEDGSEDVGGVSTTRITGKIDAAKVGPLVAVEPALGLGRRDALDRQGRRDPAADRGRPARSRSKEQEDAVRTVELSRFGEPVTVEAPEGAS